jgi:hemolysin activation/secretion protein
MHVRFARRTHRQPKGRDDLHVPMTERKAQGRGIWIHGAVAAWAMFLVVVALPAAAQVDNAAPGRILPDSIKPGAAEPRPLPRERDFFEGEVISPPPAEVPAAPAADAPRFAVSGIRLEGVVENEDLGVRRADLETIVADALTGSARLSLDDLRAVAGAITGYYRDRGFVLAQAYVPKQTVDDGTVTIRVVPGLLGDVVGEGNRDYDDEQLQKPFRSLFDNPVIDERIETALLVLRDFPGLAAAGVFTRGSRPGTADLKVAVEDENPHDFYLNVDDHGSEFLGRYRARVDWVWNNPLGRADQLVLAGLHTLDPDNSAYGAVDYRIPFFPLNSRTPLFFGLGLSYNEFDVGDVLEALGLNGVTERAGLYVAKDFRRTRTFDFTGELGFDRKRAITRRDETQLSRDELSVFRGALRIRAQDAAIFGQPGVTRLAFDWSHGEGDLLDSMAPVDAPEASRIGAGGVRAGGDFDKFNLRLDRLQRFGSVVSLLARASAQESDDLLVSLEQFPLGGPESVRAYPLSTFLVDSGYFASLEIAFDPPSDPTRVNSSFLGRLWRDALKFSVFADYAEGDLNDPLPNQPEEVTMAGAGLGLRLNFSDRFQLLVSAARPFGTRPPGYEDEEGTRYFVAMSLRL